jgi:hypothetical protein
LGGSCASRPSSRHNESAVLGAIGVAPFICGFF